MSDGNGNGTGSIFTREAFFAVCKARAVVTAEIKGWGKVNVRKLTLGQLKSFDDAKDNYERAKLLILHSIVDGDAKPIFGKVEEIDALEMPLFKALSEAVSDVNALKVTEADSKNSVTAQTSASS